MDFDETRSGVFSATNLNELLDLIEFMSKKIVDTGVKISAAVCIDGNWDNLTELQLGDLERASTLALSAFDLPATDFSRLALKDQEFSLMFELAEYQEGYPHPVFCAMIMGLQHLCKIFDAQASFFVESFTDLDT